MTGKSYSGPALVALGTIADLTRASFDNNQQDSIFFAGVPVGTATGSLDACVAENPQAPSGNCIF